MLKKESSERKKTTMREFLRDWVFVGVEGMSEHDAHFLGDTMWFGCVWWAGIAVWCVYFLWQQIKEKM